MTDDELRGLIDNPSARADVSAVELAATFLARLERAGHLNATITLTPDLAVAQARDADRRRSRGNRLPLDGLPLVLKDNIDVADVPTTVGSRLFVGRTATEDAEVTRRLRAAGAVFLGKANMHELAFGATSANEAFGAVVNPQAPDRIPGGSSGGSGAAVAADLCVAAIGTDTGGSVRLPASLCGVSGLRPSYGAVSNRGVQPVAPTLDTVGPMARSVRDVRAMLSVVWGHDPADPTSNDIPLDLRGHDEARGLRIGIVEGLLDASSPVVAACVRSVADVLGDLGALLESVDLPGWDDAVEECGMLIRGEAHAAYEDALVGRPGVLEEGTQRRLALAAGLSADDLVRLRHERQRWARRLEVMFERLDLLLLPTIPIEAPLASNADTVKTTEAVVPFTFPVAFAHLPALSLPCGATPNGAPVGTQLVAARGRDGLPLRAGVAVQAVTDWHRRRPPATAVTT